MFRRSDHLLLALLLLFAALFAAYGAADEAEEDPVLLRRIKKQETSGGLIIPNKEEEKFPETPPQPLWRAYDTCRLTLSVKRTVWHNSAEATGPPTTWTEHTFLNDERISDMTLIFQEQTVPNAYWRTNYYTASKIIQVPLQGHTGERSYVRLVTGDGVSATPEIGGSIGPIPNTLDDYPEYCGTSVFDKTYKELIISCAQQRVIWSASRECCRYSAAMGGIHCYYQERIDQKD